MSDYIPLLTCLLDSTSSQAQQENAWLALGYLYTIKPFSVNHIHFIADRLSSIMHHGLPRTREYAENLILQIISTEKSAIIIANTNNNLDFLIKELQSKSSDLIKPLY